MNKNRTILDHAKHAKTSLDDIVNVMGILHDYTTKDGLLLEKERINSLIFILWDRLDSIQEELNTALDLLEEKQGGVR